MQTKPKLSVVMATYRRVDVLPQTIRHLEEQQLDPELFEVIVVDDGSEDGTRQVVTQAIKRVPFRTRYLYHENRGPGYSQNQGILQAEAPIVVLMPDDILMSPGGLKAHLEAHEEHPEQGVAILGNIVQSPQMNQSVFLKTWDPYRFRVLPDGQELPYYMFWAINISFKRDFMLRHGMFRDEMGRAGPAAHEDVELGYRLHKHGLRIIHCKAALGYHYHVDTFEGVLRRSYQRGLNLGELLGRVPEPEIAVRYHVLNPGTLGAHFRALTGPRREYLMGPDRNPLLLSISYLLRFIVFNSLAVDHLWVPIMKKAEHSRFFSRLVHRELYRGVIAHYSQKGQREAKRIYND